MKTILFFVMIGIGGIFAVIAQTIMARKLHRQPTRLLNVFVWAGLSAILAIVLFWLWWIWMLIFSRDWLWLVAGIAGGCVSGVIAAYRLSRVWKPDHKEEILTFLVIFYHSVRRSRWGQARLDLGRACKLLAKNLQEDWKEFWPPRWLRRFASYGQQRQKVINVGPSRWQIMCRQAKQNLRSLWVWLKSHPIILWLMFAFALAIVCWLCGFNPILGLTLLALYALNKIPGVSKALDFLLARHVPWYAKYQRKEMPEIPIGEPYNFPWIDPRDKIQSMPAGVPFVSWVPHWSRTLYKPIWLYFGFALVAITIAYFLKWWVVPIALLLLAIAVFVKKARKLIAIAIPILVISAWLPLWFTSLLVVFASIITLYTVELTRWHEVYTLADNQRIYLLAKSWKNWFPELRTIIDLSKNIDIDEEIDVQTTAFGCARKISFASIGGGPIVTLDFVPWSRVMLRVLQFAGSNLGKSISLTYTLGLHWLGFLERVTQFRNRIGHLWRGAKISWDWMEPPVILAGPKRGLNTEWPTTERGHREKNDLEMSPEKAYFLSVGIWGAWKEYKRAIEMERTPEEAHRAGTAHLRYLVRADGARWEAGLHAWETKGLSPFSVDWEGFYLPALERVACRWGSFTTPGPGTDVVQGIRRQT